MKSTLMQAGNTQNPTLLVLRQKGYEVSVFLTEDDSLFWEARSSRFEIGAHSAEALLGLACVLEVYGENWQQSEPDLLSEVLANPEPPLCEENFQWEPVPSTASG